MRSMCKCVCVDESRSALTCSPGAQESKGGSRRTPRALGFSLPPPAAVREQG